MATNLLIVGCIISFIGFLSSGFFILAYYGIFAPSGFIGPTTNGFPVVQIVSPWDMKSNGELTLILENKVGEGIQIKKIYVNGREASFSIFSLNLADGERSNPIIVNTDQGGNTGSNYAIDLSIEYCIVEAGCSNNFNSTGSISGTYS